MLVRNIEVYARRLQVWLTEDVARAVADILRPKAVGVNAPSS